MELLERTRELSSLEEALAAVRGSGEGRVVVVSGEAGIGKTSLLSRFAADHRQATFLFGYCDPLFAPRPLGPLLDIADNLDGDFREALSAGSALHELVGALVRSLAPGGAPAVVVFEDVHWADEATLDVLRLLIRRVDDVR